MAQAFGRHPRVFDEMYVAMLAAGEEAGVLDEVMKRLSTLLEKEYEIHKNVRGALFYPKIVVTVISLAVVALMIFVIPKFISFYGQYGATLPLPTRILIWTSDVIRNLWYVVLAIIVIVMIAYRRYGATREGRLKIDAFRLRIPVFGELRIKIANARFGYILSALYRSGLAMPRSLDVVANAIGNAAFARQVRNVQEEVQRGATLSQALAKQKVFSPIMVETTAVGEQAGALGEMLNMVAEHFDVEVNYMVKNLTTLLEPILIISIFGVVLLLALAIYLPVWNLSEAVSGKM
jgi:type II secretory pathway component PulF